jgi:hypothetical protein
VTLVFSDCNVDGPGDASQQFIYLPDNGQWLSAREDQSCIEGMLLVLDRLRDGPWLRVMPC